MTPCEALGYKIGDAFKVLKFLYQTCEVKHVALHKEDVVILIEDDGTDTPLFEIGDGRTVHIDLDYLSKYPNPPHKHRDLIIEWANGADIQIYILNEWHDDENPCWGTCNDYRIKPQKSERDLEIEAIQKQMDELKERIEKLKGE